MVEVSFYLVSISAVIPEISLFEDLEIWLAKSKILGTFLKQTRRFEPDLGPDLGPNIDSEGCVYRIIGPRLLTLKGPKVGPSDPQVGP